MYLSHYNLHHMPFQISPDPRFLWLGEKHKEALSVLKYGVISNQGFLLLTGDVGTGKTTLIHALLNSLGPDTVSINVTDPRLDKLDFFKLVSHSLGLESRLRTKFDFLVSFESFLNRAHEDNKKVLLIIDEAQKLSLDSLEEIRLLSNIERQDTKLLNIFFVGQNEFNDTLAQPECRALRQRITMVYKIEPLSEKETAEYVKYRLRVAGALRQVFTDKALRKIYAFSKGYPRLINTICDRALLDGYSEDLQTIDHTVIGESAGELRLPGQTGKHASKRAARGTGAHMRYSTRVALLACLVVVLAVSAFVIVPGLLGDHAFNFRKYYQALAGMVARNRTELQSIKTETQETGHASQQAPLPSPPSTETSPQQTPETASQGGKALKALSPAGLKTSEQGDHFQEVKLMIPFANNTNELPPEILAKLDELAGYLQRKMSSEIVLRGYTDALGSTEYNKSLSAFRANVVKSYLTGKGISPDRMRVIGMGDAAPRMPNTTSEGRAANRRVEIELVTRTP
jgi:general secretion pathway protein A